MLPVHRPSSDRARSAHFGSVTLALALVCTLAWATLGCGADTGNGEAEREGTSAGVNGEEEANGNDGSETGNGEAEREGTSPGVNGEEEANGNDDEADWAFVEEHWIRQATDPRYPYSQYVVGVGISGYAGPQSYEEAEQQGRQSILAFFETEIRSEFQRYQEQIIRAGEDVPPEVRQETFARSSLSAIVEGTLEAEKVAERAINPEETQVAALVVVERTTMADNLTPKIERLKERIRTALERARQMSAEGRYLGALQDYSPITRWQQELVALVQQYNLVRPPGYPDIELEFNVAENVDEIVENALQLTFAFKIEAEASDPDGAPLSFDVDAEGEVIRQLRDLGVRVSVKRSTSRFREASDDEIREMSAEEVRELLDADVPVNYVLTGTIKIEYSSSRETGGQELLFYRPLYRLELIELETNETTILADSVGRGQGAGRSPSQAASGALAQAARQLAAKLTASFTEE